MLKVNVIPLMALGTFGKSDHFSNSSIVVCNLVSVSQTIMLLKNLLKGFTTSLIIKYLPITNDFNIVRDFFLDPI
jgi:hypothetical protein